MKRIQLNGHLHAAPFDRLFRPLTDQERDGMRRSIEAGGVLSPVHVYLSPTHGRAIVDGIHRAELAAELGVEEVPFLSLGRLTDEEAEAKAYDLNAKRRHLTADELAAMVAERKERAVALKAEGKLTIREIADEVGLPKSTVGRAITPPSVKPPCVPSGTSEPAPVTVEDGPADHADEPDTDIYDDPDEAPAPAAPAPLAPTHRPEPSDGEKLEAARKAGTRFVDAVLAALNTPVGARVVAASRRHGFPASKADGQPWRWPALEAVVGALNDAAAEGAA